MSYEHRSSVRLPLELLARIRWRDPEGRDQEADGKTTNISGNGLFLTVPVRLDAETPITFTVLLPRGVTGTPIELVGQGRVVRRGAAGDVEGVAAVIDDYQLLPSRLDA